MEKEKRTGKKTMRNKWETVEEKSRRNIIRKKMINEKEIYEKRKNQ